MPTELSKNEQIALQITCSLYAGKFENKNQNKEKYTYAINAVLEMYDTALEILKKRESNQST